MFNFMPSANINRETGIRFGVISGNSLDPDVLNSIQDKVFDLEYDTDDDDLTVQQLIEKYEAHGIDPDLDYFAEDFDCSEPSGTIEYDGLIVTFDWLGGCPLLIINESPFVTFANPCSPCVPNAGDLDNLDPDGVECYDVPENWRSSYYD